MRIDSMNFTFIDADIQINEMKVLSVRFQPARSFLAYVYRGLYITPFEFSKVDFLEIGWEARLTALAN